MKQKKYNLKNSEIATRKDAYMVSPLDINVNHETNPRVDYGGVEDDGEFTELKNSIKEFGLLQPVYVYIEPTDGTLHLAHGFRRMKAIHELIKEGVSIEKIDVKPIEKNEETILLQHFVQNTGKKLSDLELGDTLLQLSILTGEDNLASISRRSGIKYEKVVRLINFAKKASTKMKKAVREKKLSIGNAIAIANATDSIAAQNEVLDEASISTGEGKIKPSAIKILKATTSPYAKLHSFIEIVKGTKNDDLDLDFTKRLENLLNDIENKSLTEKQIIGKYFTKFTIEA